MNASAALKIDNTESREERMDKTINPELVKRARDGDIEAFASLYETVYKDMYRLALYMLKDKQDAEDAVAETVADAYSSIGKLREPGAFRGWIFRILSIKCKNMLKGYIDKTIPIDALGEDEPADNSRISEADAQIIRSLFYELSETDRTIISMHVFGGYKSDEIGEILEMNPSTVRSREKRALAAMRKELA